MSEAQLAYLLLAGIAAAVLAFFMYGYRASYNLRMKWVLGLLRFVTLFALILLWINPKITSVSFEQVKPRLNLLLDNSSSVTYLDRADLMSQLGRELWNNTELAERFDLSTYTFGEELRAGDSLDFTEKFTDIAGALNDLAALDQESRSATILLSDGNQTLGSDYRFLSGLPFPVYAVVLGDTLRERDVKVSRVNANRYAYLKNRFPVEVTVNYSGDGTEQLELTIERDGQVLASETLAFDAQTTSHTVEFLLTADRLGVSTYRASVQSFPNEKNRANNQKPFAVEVIDERTDVALVSGMVHPDLGMWKKAIESNEQRTTQLLSPDEAMERLDEFELVILYQPDRSFADLLRRLQESGTGVIFVTGLSTDWGFLSLSQPYFEKEYTGQDEQVTALLNPIYGTFAIEDPGFESYPPLYTSLGELFITVPHQVALRQQIANYDTGNAMLATLEADGRKVALMDGEGIWRWRARSYVDNGSFEDFDAFVSQLVLYLASSERKLRLDVRSESFYYTNDVALLTAQYFDENYVFDSRVSLECTVINQDTGERRLFPMILKNNYYGLELNDLPAGNYSYQVSVADANITASGSFELIAFDLEQQFLNPDVTRLDQLATNTQGALFYGDQLQQLTDQLMNSAELTPVQERDEKTVPLIDWTYLLAVIAMALSLEWFIRKYNGLI